MWFNALMEQPTSPQALDPEEVIVQNLTTTTSRKAEVQRIKTVLNTQSAAKVLKALGHPGYGENYAARCLDAWEALEGNSLHSIVYGTWLR